MMTRLLTAFLLSFFLAIGDYSFAWAQYPNRPINMIVPYAPGGGADLGSRVIADRMAEFLGQRMVSVYKPGGGGSLGAAFVAKAGPDGYTVLVGSQTPLVLSPIVKKMEYKLEDFMLIGNYGCIPLWLAVKADAKWKTLKEFVDDAKKAGGKMTVGSYGKLTLADFVILLFSKHAGITLTHVPFKSSGEALTNVLGKNVDSALVSGAGGLLESGSVRILAVAEKERLDGLADVPTFSDLGYPVVVRACYSFAVPKGTPKEAVEKLYQAQKKAFERYPNEIKEGLRKVELWGSLSSPEEAMAAYKSDYQLLYKLAEELGAVAK